MKRFYSFLCSAAFMICGIAMAITAKSPPTNNGNNMYAATLPTVDMSTMRLPQDLLLDLTKSSSSVDLTTTNTDSILVDSLKSRIYELECKEQVTKVKWRKVSVPKPVIQTDTIIIPVYYLATQTGNRSGPDGECISIYEVHKVDEICPENTISSVKGDTLTLYKSGD